MALTFTLRTKWWSTEIVDKFHDIQEKIRKLERSSREPKDQNTLFRKCVEDLVKYSATLEGKSIMNNKDRFWIRSGILTERLNTLDVMLRVFKPEMDKDHPKMDKDHPSMPVGSSRPDNSALLKCYVDALPSIRYGNVVYWSNLKELIYLRLKEVTDTVDIKTINEFYQYVCPLQRHQQGIFDASHHDRQDNLIKKLLGEFIRSQELKKAQEDTKAHHDRAVLQSTHTLAQLNSAKAAAEKAQGDEIAVAKLGLDKTQQDYAEVIHENAAVQKARSDAKIKHDQVTREANTAKTAMDEANATTDPLIAATKIQIARDAANRATEIVAPITKDAAEAVRAAAAVATAIGRAKAAALTPKKNIQEDTKAHDEDLNRQVMSNYFVGSPSGNTPDLLARKSQVDSNLNNNSSSSSSASFSSSINSSVNGQKQSKEGEMTALPASTGGSVPEPAAFVGWSIWNSVKWLWSAADTPLMKPTEKVIKEGEEIDKTPKIK